MRMITFIFLFLCTVLSLGFSASAFAHGPKFTHLGQSAYIAEDPEGLWLAEDVALGRYDDQFRRITTPVENLNFTTSTWWVRFQITNGTRNTSEFYLEAARPLTNVVNLYRVHKAHTQLLFRTGDALPFDSRPLISRNFVFPVTLAPSDTMNLMLKLASDGEVITLPIKLWQKDNYSGFIQRENLTLGIYYGLLFFVTGLFLFFAFVIRQKIYTFYVSYVACLFFMQA